jgi:hypothetical protein
VTKESNIRAFLVRKVPMISTGPEALNIGSWMQSFGIESNGSYVIEVETGEAVAMERETLSFLDGRNDSDLLRTKREKRIASKEKARRDPHGIKKRKSRQISSYSQKKEQTV